MDPTKKLKLDLLPPRFMTRPAVPIYMPAPAMPGNMTSPALPNMTTQALPGSNKSKPIDDQSDRDSDSSDDDDTDEGNMTMGKGNANANANANKPKRRSGTRRPGARRSGARQSGARQPGTRQSGTRQSGTRRSGIRRRSQSVGAEPEVPDLSEEDCPMSEEFNGDVEDDLWSVKRRHNPNPNPNKGNIATAMEDPKVFSFEIDGGKTVVNVNLGDIVKHAMDLHLIIPEIELCSKERVDVAMYDASDHLKTADAAALDLHGKTLVQSKAPGFLDLSWEVRMKIYRMLFRGEEPVNMESCRSLQRSSALLRTCKTIHEEGRVILYRENSFHFGRSIQTRGKYWEERWKEIGWIDVRRFFDTIGPANFAHMNHMSFNMYDSGEKALPGTDGRDRKFVNDPHLQHVLRMIAANTTLLTLAVAFCGRAHLSGADFHFLKAFIQIKCHKLVFINSFSGRPHKCLGDLPEKLRAAMIVRDEKGEPAAAMENQHDKVKMIYDVDYGSGVSTVY